MMKCVLFAASVFSGFGFRGLGASPQGCSAHAVDYVTF